MAKTFIFHGFDGIYTSIFSIFSSKYIQLAVLEVPILCSSLQERLMAKRSRARGAGSLPEDRNSFHWCFFLFTLQGNEKTYPTKRESRKIRWLKSAGERKGIRFLVPGRVIIQFWLTPQDDPYQLHNRHNVSELKVEPEVVSDKQQFHSHQFFWNTRSFGFEQRFMKPGFIDCLSQQWAQRPFQLSLPFLVWCPNSRTSSSHHTLIPKGFIKICSMRYAGRWATSENPVIYKAIYRGPTTPLPPPFITDRWRGPHLVVKKKRGFSRFRTWKGFSTSLQHWRV